MTANDVNSLIKVELSPFAVDCAVPDLCPTLGKHRQTARVYEGLIDRVAIIPPRASSRLRFDLLGGSSLEGEDPLWSIRVSQPT